VFHIINIYYNPSKCFDASFNDRRGPDLLPRGGHLKVNKPQMRGRERPLQGVAARRMASAWSPASLQSEGPAPPGATWKRALIQTSRTGGH